ncbi:hypothetical protein FCM35_KLT21307 [Carex littledalei]|uniref:Uncharacterized protein n=1 Tax=Carex littledalei TaxID=544730 RepID=A0A833RHD4_9POAL|nr:hypothetical protein FCM35_KLT21307 [Carex littledalei]
MAEELGYSSRSDFKRKYDDSDTPPPRRQYGFSSAPMQDKAPSQSYNNVPPPMDEIEAAKQRAQAIAAKLFSDAEAKRPKTNNGSDLGNEPQLLGTEWCLLGAFGCLVDYTASRETAISVKKMANCSAELEIYSDFAQLE